MSGSEHQLDGQYKAEIQRLRGELELAQAASRARAMFLATMSHEIREPMNSVLGMARLMRETVLDQEQRGYVESILDAAETLLTLINDILDLSRIDAGKLELDESDVALAPFLQRLRVLLEPGARRKGLEFRLEVAPGTPEVLRTDPSRLRQVLLNLAGNAVKFTERGHVQLRLAPAPAPEGRVGLRIEVEDTGPGIPAAAMQRMFQPFAQADQDVLRLYGGSGLGLMIARGLCQALGGKISARSAPDAGTTFTVELTLSPPDTSPGAGEPARATVAGASLLVVDAQERTRTMMVELAAGWGMSVRNASSAAQALALLDAAADRGHPFDIVLIDRDLPDLPGDQLGQRIRDQPRYARPSLALLVASGMRGDAALARAAGFAAYLPKPITAETLLGCLRSLRARGGEEGSELLTVHSMADRHTALDVLVADDNAVNCKLLQIVLERAGHRVTVVRDGSEAVTAVARRPFDLVLMDVRMPVMDGLQATRCIRELPDAMRAATPVVAVTANAMRGDAAMCYGAGMDGYVTKPITMASLSEAITRSTGRRQQHGAELA